MDSWTPEKRSEVMARIRSQDTKPELIVRSLLHRSGLRFSLRRPDLPGRPDIVLPKYRTVVFVHGCFWHRHRRCRMASVPKTRPDFWLAKFKANTKRDRSNRKLLEAAGWRVLVAWQCEILRDPFAVLESILETLDAGHKPLDYGRLPTRRTVLRVAEARLRWNLSRGNR